MQNNILLADYEKLLIESFEPLAYADFLQELDG